MIHAEPQSAKGPICKLSEHEGKSISSIEIIGLVPSAGRVVNA